MTTELSGCVVTDLDENLLLIHRDTDELRQWEVIGGKVEPGESSKKAAEREAGEEIGVEVRVVRKLGEQAFTQAGKEYNYTWWLATIAKGRPYPQERKFDQIGWFTTGQLLAREDLSPNLQNLLKKVVDGEVSLSV